jgi:hypothetical protein
MQNHDGEIVRPDSARHERHPAERLPAIQAGAQPCITAPANSTRILRHGIDSLYVSFPGQLSEASQQQLSDLKEVAQQENEGVAAKAVLPLGEHRFCVASHGRRRFPFVIDDNWFSIALASRKAKSLPMAHAQISSELLTALGPQVALATLTAIVTHLGDLHIAPQVSRADLFADFTTDTDIESIPRKAWLKRAKKRATYEDSDVLTGVAFGLGGDLSCRLYNKLEELAQSGKLYLLELWQATGWNGIDPVWRLEFQLRRPVLQQLSAPTLPELLDRLGAIWSYLTGDWLRLAIPNPHDDTRTRWPTHPMWERVAALEGVSAPSAARVTRARIPSDQTLFRQGLAGLTSFMAREGISEIGEGLRSFMYAAQAYHTGSAPEWQGDERLQDYIARKVTAKFRRFNTTARHEPD